MIIRDVLPNGVRVVAERMPSFRSVSMGVWAGAGSVNENSSNSGISHFIEHMLFKGTTGRSAADIAAEMDAVGGSLNAYTSKECTCYYAKVLGENMDLAADMLSDMVCSPRLDEADIEREKGVVLEEILMQQDDPEDLSHEMLSETIFGGSPLSGPILGTEETVKSFTAEDMLGYMGNMYSPSNLVISCAGNFEHEELMKVLKNRFLRPAAQQPTAPKSGLIDSRQFRSAERKVEQLHICIGFPGFAADTKGQFALFVLNNALGGSMSSRLFQKIREEHGMAYSVYSYPTSYKDTGYFTMYAGTGERQAARVTELMLGEVDSMLRKGMTKDEFARCKQQLKGSYMLGIESTSSRSSAIGKGELLRGRAEESDEMIARLESITMDDVMEIIPYVLDVSRMACAAVGRGGDAVKEVERVFMGA